MRQAILFTVQPRKVIINDRFSDYMYLDYFTADLSDGKTVYSKEKLPLTRIRVIKRPEIQRLFDPCFDNKSNQISNELVEGYYEHAEYCIAIEPVLADILEIPYKEKLEKNESLLAELNEELIRYRNMTFWQKLRNLFHK